MGRVNKPSPMPSLPAINAKAFAQGSVSSEAIHSFLLLRDGLLRGACHRARISRDPLARNSGIASRCRAADVGGMVKTYLV
jgi:hypothetical protein